MNQALAGERGLGSAPPTGAAVKMMEGKGKGIIRQIKKIPHKVTSASLCTRPKIIPVICSERQRSFFPVELQFWLKAGWCGQGECQG